MDANRFPEYSGLKKLKSWRSCFLYGFLLNFLVRESIPRMTLAEYRQMLLRAGRSMVQGDDLVTVVTRQPEVWVAVNFRVNLAAKVKRIISAGCCRPDAVLGLRSAEIDKWLDEISLRTDIKVNYKRLSGKRIEFTVERQAKTQWT
jgi:hypothetical protein